MSWITIIWSMSASACLTLALLNFFIWCRQRDVWANLLFALVGEPRILWSQPFQGRQHPLRRSHRRRRTVPRPGDPGGGSIRPRLGRNKKWGVVTSTMALSSKIYDRRAKRSAGHTTYLGANSPAESDPLEKTQEGTAWISIKAPDFAITPPRERLAA